MQVNAREIYRERKRFFNDHAEVWLDKWYKNSETGRYDRHDKDFERLFALIPLKRGDHVLDAGCGSGVLVPFILERVAESGMIYELDFAEKMIAVNRARHTHANIRFIVADAEHAPLDEASCDAVICFSCFPHFQDKGKAVTALARALKAGGVLVVAHFDSSGGINRHHEKCPAVMHDHLPDNESMRALLEERALQVELFIDEPGFYCILARKEPAAAGQLPG